MSNNQTNFSEKAAVADGFDPLRLNPDRDENHIEPFVIFDYSIRSAQTKDTYFRRLRTFFKYSLIEGETFRDKCNNFAIEGQENPQWAFKLILNFIQFQKQRVVNKEIKSGTLRNFQKTIKSFCESTDILIPWKKITKGLPRGKRSSDDRAPTLEEIRLICNYPDRRISAIVSVMTSSGIRVGAWDYLKWGHITPILDKNDPKIVLAAKLRVYADDDDEYLTFISNSAYCELVKWMNFREKSGEKITSESWVLRNLWNTEKNQRKNLSIEAKNGILNPKKLSSIGVKRLMERALWTQNLRIKTDPSSKRYAFPVDHGFRRFYKTRCEIGGMKPANIELLLGHDIGISSSYYKPTEEDLLKDYLGHVEHLLISSENKIQSQVDKLSKENENNTLKFQSELEAKDKQIFISEEKIETNNDAMIALSDKIIEITQELESIKSRLNLSRSA